MEDEFELTQDNGIYMPHLSASTVNKFIEDRYGFYQSKVIGERFKPNVKMARGTAVEHGVNLFVTGTNTMLVEMAIGKFDEEVNGIECDPQELKEVRDSIPGLLNLAIDHYREAFAFSNPEIQSKISAKLPGVSRELTGYLDYLVPKKVVRDCKVVGVTPSKLKQGYIIQGSLYKFSTGLDVVFDFFVANKKPVVKSIKLTDNDYAFGLSYLIEACKVIEEIQVCESAQRMMQLMSFPNLEAMWTLSDKKEAANKYNIKL